MILQLVKNQVNKNLEGNVHNIAFYELYFLHMSCFRKVKFSYEILFKFLAALDTIVVI